MTEPARRGPGRPRSSSEPRVSVTARFIESEHETLRRTCEERDISVNLLITKAVKVYIDQLPPLDEVLP